MWKRSYARASLLVALGGLLGYAAAAGHLRCVARRRPPRPDRIDGRPADVDRPGRRRVLPRRPRRPALHSPGAGQKVRRARKDGKKPNILFIMGDDIGMWNIGAYHRGMMAGRTPNLDKMAKEGMLFTDYYAEASCTAGRANFITGELPIRTGMTTVGQAGAKTGLPAEACTIATALKAQGYATGQFGKNHLGDRNEFLPTVHGFDEFFGYLYHLDAMEDPAHPELSAGPAGQGRPAQHGPLAGRPTRTTPTEMPRWGKVGKQKIEDAGTLYPEADGNRGRRDPRPRPQVHRQGQGGRQAVLLLAQPDAHAHRHAPLGEVREDCATRRTAGRYRKPAWPSSTTTSASS